jgi:hypothetical protein
MKSRRRIGDPLHHSMWKPSRSGLHGNEQKRRHLKLMGPTKRRLVRLIAVTSSGHSRLHTSFDLFDRQLHEYSPAEGRRHRRVSGEHVAAMDVLRDTERCAGGCLAPRQNLSETRNDETAPFIHPEKARGSSFGRASA